MTINAQIIDRKTLTAREAEVLELICTGRPIKMIAKDLDISPSTVGTHVERIQYKLNAHSLLQIAVIATADGLVRISRHTCLLICLFMGSQLDDNLIRHRTPRSRGAAVRISHVRARGADSTI